MPDRLRWSETGHIPYIGLELEVGTKLDGRICQQILLAYHSISNGISQHLLWHLPGIPDLTWAAEINSAGWKMGLGRREKDNISYSMELYGQIVSN
jgi:hypothetical protein